MSRTFFTSLSDWRILVETIEKQRDAQRDEALETYGPNADLTLAAREFHRGWYDALNWVLGLPDEILKDSTDEEGKEQEKETHEVSDAKRVVPERPQRRISKIY